MNLCRVTGLFQYLSAFSIFRESSQPQERLILATWTVRAYWQTLESNSIIRVQFKSTSIQGKFHWVDKILYICSHVLLVMTQSEPEILEARRQFWVQKSAPTIPFWLLAAGLHQNMIFSCLSNIHICIHSCTYLHNYIVSCSVRFLETTTCFHFFTTSLDPLKSACFIFFLNFYWSTDQGGAAAFSRLWPQLNLTIMSFWVSPRVPHFRRSGQNSVACPEMQRWDEAVLISSKSRSSLAEMLAMN